MFRSNKKPKLKPIKEIRSAENEVRNYADLNDLAMSFIHYVCNELGIVDQIITIAPTNLKVQALIYMNSGNIPMILVNSEEVNNLFVALAHELFHLKQHIEGRWDLKKGTTVVRDGDVEYVSELAEEIEKETRNNQYGLWRSFRKNERFKRINKRRTERYERRRN